MQCQEAVLGKKSVSLEFAKKKKKGEIFTMLCFLNGHSSIPSGKCYLFGTLDWESIQGKKLNSAYFKQGPMSWADE